MRGNVHVRFGGRGQGNQQPKRCTAPCPRPNSGRTSASRLVRHSAASTLLVLVIGPGFDVGRLSQSTDYVRAEVLEAFNLHKQIVPVLVDDASMPRPDELPPALERLSYRNTAPLRPDPDFDLDAERVVRDLRRGVEQRRAARSPPICRAARRRAVNNPGRHSTNPRLPATLDHRRLPVDRSRAPPGDRCGGPHGRDCPRDRRRGRSRIDPYRPGSTNDDHFVTDDSFLRAGGHHGDPPWRCRGDGDDDRRRRPTPTPTRTTPTRRDPDPANGRGHRDPHVRCERQGRLLPLGAPARRRTTRRWSDSRRGHPSRSSARCRAKPSRARRGVPATSGPAPSRGTTSPTCTSGGPASTRSRSATRCP